MRHPATVDRTPYWFRAPEITKIEKAKNAVHLGAWCLKNARGGWSEQPADIFYTPNPDTSKGHTNYFGLFYRDDTLYITKGDSAFPEAGMDGKLLSDGRVLVSRYRHDYRGVTDGEEHIVVDGGRDYFRASIAGKNVRVFCVNGAFEYEVVDNAHRG